MIQKSNVQAIIVSVIITAIVVGGGMYLWQQSKAVQPETRQVAVGTVETAKENSQEPLSYSTDGIAFEVSKQTAPFGYDANNLVSMAKGCGYEQTRNYFNSLIAKFNGATRTVYRFKYVGDSQATDTFVVTLLPNKPGYSSLDQFKKDFDLCDAGGDAYPMMLNENWLLFVNGCGTGYADDSGNPSGCQEVKDAIESTLKLN